MNHPAKSCFIDFLWSNKFIGVGVGVVVYKKNIK